ncbi:VOC family protein [Bordetella genomosp. 13]|uniref:Lactoylglutathione lyase n=1 Tax=Bordetella genomosp. 13 TaxID=463040 RepID=A0A1W6ZAS4_9BORD|nr:VOC family protein [Bordetella genomosp. 13]ARP94496.1 lactoylglutathione lyase [Bordetella genomosp. 13]
MFSHITVGTDDLERAGRFYDAILFPLGLVRRHVEPDGFADAICWIVPGQPLPCFYAHMPFNGEPATVGNGCMVAFRAASPKQVDQAYAAGMAAGGSDEGPPGERRHYAPGYYGAYMRDPDGNKVHIVHRGDHA